VPVVLIGFWGYFYVRTCFLTLATTSGPVEYALNTKSGLLKIRAEGVQVNLPQNFIHINSLSVHEPNGKLLASARYGDVTGLIPMSLGAGRAAVTAHVYHVFGRIERLSNGQLKLANYFPETTPPTSDVPFIVQVDDTTISFEDFRGTNLWQSRATVPRLKIDGVGQRWVASGVADVEKIGHIEAEVRKDPDQGLTIDGNARRFDLEPIAKHILSTPDVQKLPQLRDISAKYLVISGPLRLFIPNRGQSQYEANVVADAADLVYRNQVEVPSAHFEGILTHAGLKGVVSTVGKGLSATYTGAYSWSKESVLGGSLKGKIYSFQDAPKWLQRFLPNGTRFENGSFDGWVSYSGGGTMAINGLFDASYAEYRGERLVAPHLKISASSERVALDLASGSWNSAPVRGAINYVPKTRQIEGLLVANQVSLGQVGRRIGVKNVQGSGQIQALVTGLATAPFVDIRATGTGRAYAANRRIDIGHIVAAADFSNGMLNLRRLSLNSPDGVATAQGTWAQKSNELNIDVVGNGIPLSALAADAKGRASFLGKVSGRANAPRASGRVEMYAAELGGEQIPLAMADISTDGRRVVADRFDIFKNATRASGNAVVDLKTRAVSGKVAVADIQLTDWLKEHVAGVLDIPGATVSGTLDHLRVQGGFSGTNIVAQGVKVNNVAGSISLDGNRVRLADAIARFDTGEVTANADYDLKSRGGVVNARASGIDLGHVIPQLPVDTTVTGLLNGSFSARLVSGAVREAQGLGDLQKVAVNDVYLGGGPFSLKNTGDNWSGNISVGSLESFLEVNNATYNSRQKTLAADADAHNVALKTLYSMAKRYLASSADPEEKRQEAVAILPANVMDQLESMSGNVEAVVATSGPVSDPNVNVSTFAVSDINVGGRPSGTITAQAARSNREWDIQAFNWNGGPGNLSAHGKIQEHGVTDLDGEFHNLNASWLALFNPSLSHFAGDGNVIFSVTGPTKSPTIDSSVEYAEGDKNSTDRRSLSVRALAKNGEISATGSYYYNGFTGDLTASVPFEYPFTIPTDRSLTASLTLPSRSLASVQYVKDWLDPTRTVGTIAGAATVYGPVNNLKISGKANVTAPRLAARGVETTLDNFAANALFDGTALTFNAGGEGSLGGNVRVENGRIDLGNLSDVVNQSLDTLLTNQVAGALAINNLKVVQKGASPINATFAGRIDASGRLKNPRLAGQVALTEGNLSIPAAPAQGTEPFQPYIDPRFDIALSMPNPVTIKAGTGNLQLTGAGKLAGSLGLPDLDAQLLVEKGSLRLPNARITIDPGGTIHLFYQATPYGAPNERADLDLTGTTALTANPYGGTVQRYDIELQIRGNLLAENGLQLSAQADPPDLPQDQILTLLGQGGLFMLQQNGSAQPFRTDQQLQSALYTALPLLFDPFTQQLAAGLGLDYLSIEYNAYERVAITAAKSLTKNLVLSARKQLSNPLPGQRQSFDVRLSYRLPLRGKVFRNLNLSVGMDQDRPWKIGLEYGFRF
jgi:hypothetical protein